MARPKSKEQLTPLTFDATAATLEKLVALGGATALSTSQMIRQALQNHDWSSYQPVKEPHQQVSVRIPLELRNQLVKTSKRYKVSMGRLVRDAILALPADFLASLGITPQTQSNTVTAQAKKRTPKKKSVAKKAAAPKKAAKKAVKKVAAKKAVKKVAAKKAVKKAVAKKAAKKAVKKVAAKKAVRKAVAKKAVKKVAAKKAAKKSARKATKKAAK